MCYNLQKAWRSYIKDLNFRFHVYMYQQCLHVIMLRQLLLSLFLVYCT